MSQVHTGPDSADCAIDAACRRAGLRTGGLWRETAWGTVLAYDPPHRLAFSWIVELPAGLEQLVEIRFTAEEAAPGSS